ncbi:MAG: hypothetical protein ACO3L2_10415 [Chthoniobacterales bacterium]
MDLLASPVKKLVLFILILVGGYYAYQYLNEEPPHRHLHRNPSTSSFEYPWESYLRSGSVELSVILQGLVGSKQLIRLPS